MEWEKTNRSCREANALSLVDYLLRLGFAPAKIRGADYWYLSPLREEKTPSFKVNRKLNVWYDHGEGIGGTLVDFGLRYLRCSIPEFLNSLDAGDFSFQQPTYKPHLIKPEEKIVVTNSTDLNSQHLLTYLNARKIDLQIAKQYCSEVSFRLYKKDYAGIGFQNNTGGWEIRNAFQKYASSPKDLTLINNGSDKIMIFEGFMDFLSFLTVMRTASVRMPSDYLVLNGLSLFERSRPILEQYASKGLYLDNDNAGSSLTAKILESGDGFVDERRLYRGYKDLNEWLIKSGQDKKQRRKLKGRLTPFL